MEMNGCLDILVLMLENIIVKTDIIDNNKYQNIFTVESVNNLVLSGVPFRDAYKTVAMQVENNTFSADTNLNHVHEGTIGNLCNDKIKADFEKKIKLLLL
jgi:argininosuccinate lyase